MALSDERLKELVRLHKGYALEDGFDAESNDTLNALGELLAIRERAVPANVKAAWVSAYATFDAEPHAFSNGDVVAEVVRRVVHGDGVQAPQLSPEQTARAEAAQRLLVAAPVDGAGDDPDHGFAERRYSEEEIGKAIVSELRTWLNTEGKESDFAMGVLRRLRGEEPFTPCSDCLYLGSCEATKACAKKRMEGQPKFRPFRTDHATTQSGDCPAWCPACRGNVARGFNPDGSVP